MSLAAANQFVLGTGKFSYSGVALDMDAEDKLSRSMVTWIDPNTQVSCRSTLPYQHLPSFWKEAPSCGATGQCTAPHSLSYYQLAGAATLTAQWMVTPKPGHEYHRNRSAENHASVTSWHTFAHSSVWQWVEQFLQRLWRWGILPKCSDALKYYFKTITT